MAKPAFLKPALILGGLAVLLAVICWVACSTVSTPEPPTSIPDPTKVNPTLNSTSTPVSTSGDGEISVTKNSVCRVFVAKHGVFIGGKPTLIDVIYVHRDGLVQVTSERSDDLILDLQEGIAGAGAVDTFERLDTSELHPLPEAFQERGPGPVILPESGGMTLVVEVAFCDEPTQQWIGNPDDAPDSVRDIVLMIERLSQRVDSHQAIAGDKYIRSELLRPHEAKFIKSVVEVTTDELEANPLLKKALKHERRLILISNESPYDKLPPSFSRGRSAHIAYNQDVFQVRHLVVAER